MNILDTKKRNIDHTYNDNEYSQSQMKVEYYNNERNISTNIDKLKKK